MSGPVGHRTANGVQQNRRMIVFRIIVIASQNFRAVISGEFGRCDDVTRDWPVARRTVITSVQPSSALCSTVFGSRDRSLNLWTGRAVT